MSLVPSKINNKFLVVNASVQFEFSCRTVSMITLKCKHCPIPGCGSKFLVRLANHLAQVHGLSDLERKYWLQFAKLQNTVMFHVNDEDPPPKTISLYLREPAVRLVNCAHGSEIEISLPRSRSWSNVLWQKSICKTFT